MKLHQTLHLPLRHVLIAAHIAVLFGGCIMSSAEPDGGRYHLSIKDGPERAAPRRKQPVATKSAVPVVRVAATSETKAARASKAAVSPAADPMPARPVAIQSAPLSSTQLSEVHLQPRPSEAARPAAVQRPAPVARPGSQVNAASAKPVAPAQPNAENRVPPLPAAKAAAPAKILPPTPAADAQPDTPMPIAGQIERAELLLRIGNVLGAREAIEPGVKAKSPEAITELAKTYDPVELARFLVPPGTADAVKAVELYTEAAALGSAVARSRLDRLRSQAPPAEPHKK